MDFRDSSRKDIGAYGEKVVAEYLRRLGFSILAQNVHRKTGELDIVAEKDEVLHVVEVKTLLCNEFQSTDRVMDSYDPAFNLHAYKIKKVIRTAEWYVADIGWEGELQVDAAIVWVRRGNAGAQVRYYPQIID